MFRSFWGLSGGNRNRIHKKICIYISLQNIVHNINYPETRILRIESIFYNIVDKRNSEHGFVEFG